MSTKNNAIQQKERIKAALTDLGFPKDKYSYELTAISLLALMDTNEREGLILKKRNLSEGARIFDIMAYAKDDLGITYEPNSRESFRKECLYHLVDEGFAIRNADNPQRPTNSGNTNYIITENAKNLFMAFLDYDSLEYERFKMSFRQSATKIRQDEISRMEGLLVRITIPDTKQTIALSPGAHNIIQKLIVEELFNIEREQMNLVYLGDTQNKSAFVDKSLCKKLSIAIDDHEKLPDVIAFSEGTKEVFIFEAVASSGPITELRKKEIENLFRDSEFQLEMVSVFLDKKIFQKFSTVIAPETKVYLLDCKKSIAYSSY